MQGCCEYGFAESRTVDMDLSDIAMSGSSSSQLDRLRLWRSRRSDANSLRCPNFGDSPPQSADKFSVSLLRREWKHAGENMIDLSRTGGPKMHQTSKMECLFSSDCTAGTRARRIC